MNYRSCRPPWAAIASELRAAHAAGADAAIVQGVEAGGHGSIRPAAEIVADLTP